MNIVWGTASTGGYGGTVFPGGVRYSLVNNVCGVRYSLGYRIHSDTGSGVRMQTARCKAEAAVVRDRDDGWNSDFMWLFY